MSLDLIEIALERMTDFVAFERLATEIMYLDGWHDIKPLGGTADLGQDATSEKLLRNGDVERTVFQYTLQDSLPGKITDTIVKLRDNGVAFSELILVTPHSLSAESQIKMKRDARANYAVSLEIYERKTLLTRLADLDNGIFNRHFPNIRAQLDDITAAATRAALPQDAQERTLLQVSLALTFAPGANRARKSVFDHFVLAVVLGNGTAGIAVGDLGQKCSEAIDAVGPFPREQVDAATARLTRAGLLKKSTDVITATEKAFAEIASGTNRLQEATKSFAADIVRAVEDARGKRVSTDVARRITRNVREALLEIARSRGATFAAADTADTSVPDIVRRQLSDDVAGLAVAAMAEALRSPTSEQAQTISHWTQAYVGLALMGLDPTLNGFQASRFSKKIFILDTDLVVEALITDGPRSPGIRALLNSLAKLGCRLIVPELVIAECIKHAAVSQKTYDFFGVALHQLTPALVEERVWNAFVKGFYYARESKRVSSSTSYEQYLANYYEPKRGRQFMVDTIKETLPREIEVRSLESLLEVPLDADEVARFAKELQKHLAASKKAVYRTDQEAEALAKNDAVLYLTTVRLNPPDETTQADVLGGTCYLMTEASRSGRAARAMGISTEVTVRPGALAAIQELIGTFDLAPSEFVQLFDNPFLDRAITAAWPDMETLIRSGIDLRGKSLPRLRFDLADALHAQLSSLAIAEDAEDKEETSETSSDEQFLELLETATARGYSVIPEVDQIRSRIKHGEQRAENLQKALDEVMARNEQLQEQIGFFGRRKQRYLKRVGRAGR